MFIATAWDLASSRRRRRAPPTLSTGRALSLSWIIAASWHTSQGRIVSIYSRYICYMLYASWFIKWTFECFTMGRRTLRCESSKGKQISIRSCQRRQNCKRKTLRGEWSEGGNALRRTAWFVVVLLSNALERKFILVRCWNLRPFAAQPAHHPHGRRPLERAYLACCSLGTWHHHSGQTVKPR